MNKGAQKDSIDKTVEGNQKLSEAEIEKLAEMTLPCGCGGKGTKPLYTKEQLEVIKQYGKLPECAGWREFCRADGTKPYERCFDGVDPGKCSTYRFGH